VTRLQVRLPDGSRVQRRFRTSCKLQTVYDYVLHHAMASGDDNNSDLEICLVTSYPKARLEDRSAPACCLFNNNLQFSNSPYVIS
jgi:hypothetical protein